MKGGPNYKSLVKQQTDNAEEKTMNTMHDSSILQYHLKIIKHHLIISADQLSPSWLNKVGPT